MNAGKTCRLCHGWPGDKLKYGPRHYAHLECVAKSGRAREILSKLTAWQLGQLRYSELKKLGILPLFGEVLAEKAKGKR